jgi:hypothetical protein
MANLKILKGLETNLPVNSTEGSLYFTEDTGRLLLGDNSGGYVNFSEVITVTSLPLTPIQNKIYSWNKGLYVWDGIEWSQVGNGTGGSLPYNQVFETTDWEVDGTGFKLEILASEHKQGTQKFLIVQVFDGTGSLNTSYEISETGLITLKSEIAFDGYVIVSNLNNSAPLYNEHGLLEGRDTTGNHEKIIPSGTSFKVLKNDGTTPVLTVNTDTGVLSVNTADYETILTDDDELPNKKYVDDGLDIKAGKDEENLFTEKQTFQAKTDASLGEELITDVRDRDFSGDSGNWTGTNWTIDSGVYTHTAGVNVATLGTYPAVSGKTYQVVMTVVTTTVGTLTIGYGGANASAIGQATGTLTDYTVVLVATGTDGLTLTPNGAWEGTIDNVSVKEITPASSIADYQNSMGVLGIEIRTSNDTSMGVGFSALRNNTTGINNTAVGVQALRNNTTGQDNTANGTYALRFNTTGNSNTASGRDALRFNTTGSNNTASGRDALRFNTTGEANMANGVNALYNNTTGSENTAVGTTALYSNTTGIENTAVGRSAGRYIGSETITLTNTTQSVFLGAETRALADNSTNEIVIGYNAIGGGSNTITLGNADITALRCQVTTITSLSDSRVKDEISDADLDICYDTVKNLKVSRFKYKDFTGKHNDGHKLGFMADDLEVVRPKCVTKTDREFPVLDENGEGVYREVTLDTGEVVQVPEVQLLEDVKEIAFYDDVPTLWGAVQKLMQKINVLEQEIELLKG